MAAGRRCVRGALGARRLAMPAGLLLGVWHAAGRWWRAHAGTWAVRGGTRRGMVLAACYYTTLNLHTDAERRAEEEKKRRRRRRKRRRRKREGMWV